MNLHNDSASPTSSIRRRGTAVIAGLCAALVLAGCVSTSQPHERSSGQPPGVAAPAKPTAKAVPKRKVSPPVADDAQRQPPSERPVANQRRRVGEATYYASYFQGQPTASGEPYDGQAMTAAHKTLPFGTKVRVTLLDSGETAVVRINDRGPFVPGRIIDVSERAAEQLGLVDAGTAEVRLQVLE
ncbi:septal ring lytic transglycosylase RlpA family protein [Salinicola halophilus]|uniref:septal ring lytic transglycosylase RlpA family protein n=1 Tax=Salinicola halophilus TaxID=184065 RepID=UPI000DA21976|nr:septal ring lytic transglycosylase RlpA family protein [Salinicola halophilus]